MTRSLGVDGYLLSLEGYLPVIHNLERLRLGYSEEFSNPSIASIHIAVPVARATMQLFPAANMVRHDNVFMQQKAYTHFANFLKAQEFFGYSPTHQQEMLRGLKAGISDVRVGLTGNEVVLLDSSTEVGDTFNSARLVMPGILRADHNNEMEQAPIVFLLNDPRRNYQTGSYRVDSMTPIDL